MHYTDPVPVEDTGMPLESTIRVVVARKCSAGDTLRVALPDDSIRDLAGNFLTKALSADSTCMEQPLQELPRAAQYIKFLGACLVVFVAVGLAAAAWLLWRTGRGGATPGGGAARAVGYTHSRAAPLAVALATLALLLQGTCCSPTGPVAT